MSVTILAVFGYLMGSQYNYLIHVPNGMEQCNQMAERALQREDVEAAFCRKLVIVK